MVVIYLKVKNRSQKMSWQQSEEEDGVVDNKTAETELDFPPPRGTEWTPDNKPIITAAIGAEADKRDPG